MGDREKNRRRGKIGRKGLVQGEARTEVKKQTPYKAVAAITESHRIEGR